MKEVSPSVKRRATADDVAIGEKLRALRLDRGLSQSALAGMAGVSFQQLQKYESGANRISAGRLVRTAAALKVPVTAFYRTAGARKSEQLNLKVRNVDFFRNLILFDKTKSGRSRMVEMNSEIRQILLGLCPFEPSFHIEL